MARDPQKLVARLKADLGDRVREFPVAVASDDAGRITIVLQGAGTSVTALRGLREKLQPIVKKAIREVWGGGVKFDTVPEARGADLVVDLKLTTV